MGADLILAWCDVPEVTGDALQAAIDSLSFEKHRAFEDEETT